MLTTESRYDLNRGRAQNSNTSGLTAPIDFAGFFISTLKSRECEEYPNNSACLVSRFELPTPYGLREQSSQKGILDMKNQLIFKSQTLTPVIVNNLPYLRVPQIEGALNYRSGKLLQIYNRHADEFTPEMSFLTTIDTKGGKQQVRVFSLRGCHLLAMFSKTPVAKEFRKWVLDLIEQHNQVISKMETPTVDMRAIGGLVKKCTAVAIHDELKDVLGREVKEVIKDQFIKFSLSTFACAEDLKPFQQVTDDMLLRGLYDWYSTRHHKLLDTVKELDEENGKLKSKIATIKKTVN